jgi:hypothetical protein
MFNSGIRGRRAKDGEGTVAAQAQFVQAASPQPSITSWSISGSDDNALDPAGGQTVIVNGTGFASGASVTVGGSQIGAVTVASSTQITFTSPANAGGSYTLIVYNSSGGAAILVPGLIYSAVPTWTTNAGSIGTFYETTAISSNVVATSDSAMTYSLASGSLPSGATLYANGVITGTSPVDSGSTTYTFNITATDAEFQDVTRTFTMTINTDVVTWSSPASGATYNLVGNVAMSNVSLSATSAAGYGVTYSANTLPSGVSLSGNVIYGTPNVAASTTTLLTATANTTNRTSTNTINWVVTLGDQYWNLTTLALNSLPVTTPFQSDASLNNNNISVVADTRASNRNPYQTGYYSNYFDGSGDYLSLPYTTNFNCPTSFTIEFWAYPVSKITNYPTVFSNYSTYAANGLIGIFCGHDSNSTKWSVAFNGTDGVLISTSTVVYNRWVHIAVVRNGTAMTMYVNGVAESTSTQSATLAGTQNSMWMGVAGDNPSITYYNGYVSNLRFVKDTAVYTSNFTPSTTPLVNVSGTSLLTCQSYRLIDASPNNSTITKNGDTTVLPFNPFATVNDYGTTYYSTYFDGTGDYLTATIAALGSSDWTIEAWVYPTRSATEEIPIGCGPNASGSWELFLSYPSYSSKVRFNIYGDTNVYVSSTNYNANAWNHIAVVRSSGTITVYLNGVGGTSTAINPSYNNSTVTGLVIGRGYTDSTSGSFIGSVSNARITKGQALYTSNFTPATSPLTTTSQGATASNVSILTCQNATLIDNSTNALAITSNGQAQPQPTSPFTTTNYTTASTTIPTLGSGYFDGTGDYLNAGSIVPAFGTSAYTVEFWVYPLSLSSVHVYIRNSSTGGWQVYYDTTSGVGISSVGTGGFLFAGLGALVVNQWNHVAICRDSTASNATRNYVNGILKATGTDSTNWTVNNPLVIGANSSGTEAFNGYMSNARIIKGTALYTANFYPSPTPLTAVTNTQLLTCQYNGGSNDSQFVDTSNLQNTITRAGNTTQGTVSPFSATGWSGYFDGTGDYISPNNSTGLGAGDFTIEAWIYPTTALQNEKMVFDWRPASSATTQPFLELITSSSVQHIRFRNASYPSGIVSGGTVVTNAWNHVAVTRSGSGSNNVKLFINGVLINQATNTDTFAGAANRPYLGANDVASTFYTGYISNARIVIGTALYTAAFTPSTTPLRAVSGTNLLTLQSPQFVDNSANRFAITVSGDTKTQSFSPFGGVTVTPYYSNYFDGTGDYLSIADSAALQFGTGNFTVECWVYEPAQSGQYNTVIGKWGTGFGTTGDWSLRTRFNNGTQFAVTIRNTSGWYDIQTNVSVSDNTWHHLAFVRDSATTIKLYIDGVLSATQAVSSTDIVGSSATMSIGGNVASSTGEVASTGYISNVRITKGQAVYTGAFTPPTAPLAATQSSGTNIAAITQTSYSNYFDGTGDYLSLATNTSMDFSTGDFTVEGWVYPTSLAADWFLISATGSGGLFVGYATGIGFGWGRTGVAWDYRPGVLTANTWQHVAVTRSGTSMRIFVNGTQAGTTQSLSTAYNLGTTSTTIGSQGANYYLNGMISNLRITKGLALYTANFTPSTTPLTINSQGATAANVSLLTCQSSIFTDNSTNSPNAITVTGNTAISGSNPFSGSTMLLTSQSSTFTDNSVNAFAITVNGDTKPTTIAPFASTTTTPVSYTTAVNGGSMYFDGTGDCLTLPVNTAGTIMGYSDFTVEAWIYPTTYSGTAQVIAAGQNDQASTTGSSWCLYIASATNSDSYAGSTAVAPASPNPVKNQWSHVAYVRSGTSLKTYLNGVQVGSASFASATTAVNNGSTSYAPSIGAFSNGGSPFAGYMSNFRITKNALYTSAFVPPVNPNTNTIYTSSMIAGTNGSIIDYTGKNNLETVADAKLAPQNPYGGSYYSNYFDGSYDYLTIPSSASLGFGTGDFTIEAWVYLASSGATNGYILFDMRSAGGTEVRPSIQLNSSGTVYYWTQATNKITGGTLTTGQWTHLAVTRASGSTKLFLNGTQSGSTYSDSTDYGSSNRMVIGNTADFPASYNASWNGYVSNFRVVKGQALYTGTFTPSTSPLTTTSQSATAGNVSLLTCQSNTIKDNSNNAFTITASGNTSVNSINPFQNNGTYSMYFDGTGDYLKAPSSANYQFGTGDFTIEFWVYLNTVASNQILYDNRVTAGLYPTIYMSTSTIKYYTNSADQITGGTLATGQWYYIALCRASGSTRLFVNGTQSGSTYTDANNYLVGTLTVGSDGAAPGSYLNGYIDDLRVTKYARYTTTFTPPTSTFQTK